MDFSSPLTDEGGGRGGVGRGVGGVQPGPGQTAGCRRGSLEPCGCRAEC